MGFFQEQKNRFQGLLDKLTNDSHVPIAVLIFVVTSAYHFHTGKDLGTNYTNSLYAIYAFLGGHALVYQKWPDKDQQAPTVDVNVNNDNTNTNVANANATPPDSNAGAAGTKG